jgi:hypothetical protein
MNPGIDPESGVIPSTVELIVLPRCILVNGLPIFCGCSVRTSTATTVDARLTRQFSWPRTGYIESLPWIFLGAGQ